MSNLLRRHLMGLYKRDIVLDPETVIAYSLSKFDLYSSGNYKIFLDLCKEGTKNALWRGSNIYSFYKTHLYIPNTKTSTIYQVNSRGFNYTTTPINPRNFSVSVKIRVKDNGSNYPNFVAVNNSLGNALDGGFAVAGKVSEGVMYPCFFNFKGKSNKAIIDLSSSVGIPISTTEYSEPHIITLGVRPYDDTNIEMFINVDGVEDSVIKNVSNINLMDTITNINLGVAIGFAEYGSTYTRADAVYHWIKVNSYNI